METRTNEVLFEWEKGKPVQGNVRPDIALSNLAVYEGKFSRLKEDRDNVAKAKEALELVEPGEQKDGAKKGKEIVKKICI